MSLPSSVGQILRDHVTLEVESIDRMYLNVYVPKLQRALGAVGFFRFHRGFPFVSSALMAPMTKLFVDGAHRFARDHDVPVVLFKKGQRKDDIARDHLKRFDGEEGVLFFGKAQEKATVFRTEKRRNPDTGSSYPWIVKSTAMVNQFYFYCLDRDFGPFFIKFCSYFPYNAKLCINGHEYVKRQLAQKGIAFEALDNGILSCEDPTRLNRICQGLTWRKIDRLLRKWLKCLPHPFTPMDRRAGYRYDVSILQAEFSLTQVFDRPLSGRQLFEQIIRENLDLGRPDHVQLVFDRRVIKRTPGRFRTRVITRGVTPSLHIDYKRTRIKQYFKEERALRTETTINNTYDFDIGRLLHNLPALREVGFKANRRLLDVQTISQDCSVGEEVLEQVIRPRTVKGQRVSGLRLDCPRVRALLSVLVLFRVLPRGFRNRDLREYLAPLLGRDPGSITPGQMTYHLRRLRLHGLIERIPQSHRYSVTDLGFRFAFFHVRLHARVLRPGLTSLAPMAGPDSRPLQRMFTKIEKAIDQWLESTGSAA